MFNNLLFTNFNDTYKNVYHLCIYGGSIYGLLIGIHEFKKIKNPFINLIGRILNHTMDGFLVGLTWPIIFPFIPFVGFEHFFKLENELKENDKK
jgi:hypothetical protein